MIGGYKSLPFYKQSEIIYDFTVEFCDRYIDKRTKTHDQMTQASRSGKKNIAEGYLQKSIEGKLKLLGVSRGSLEEILNDYQDFLRQRGLTFWKPDSLQAREVRALAYKSYKYYKSNKNYKIYIMREKITKFLAGITGLTKTEIHLETPENEEFGDYT